ncbi:hypothetical protein A242_03900 [Pseudomonas syringae pv. actinidiae ICMP 19095]|nr:hypothetical protein A242_03900 [Pseudomonas syringae pv. actinidiae ICMP 19095]EPN48696.1 hypothetical protein A241_23744 [Pseudomonas syringae pv. actinidiae ICMP 19094]
MPSASHSPKTLSVPETECRPLPLTAIGLTSDSVLRAVGFDGWQVLLELCVIGQELKHLIQ